MYMYTSVCLCVCVCVCEERARTQTHDATTNEQRRRHCWLGGSRGNVGVRARVQINAKQLPLAVRYQSAGGVGREGGYPEGARVDTDSRSSCYVKQTLD